MYFDRVETYPTTVKDHILRNINDDEKDRVWQVLTLPTKESIKNQESFLKKAGIVNGVGPSRWSKTWRRIFDSLFPSVDSFFHDIEFFIGGDENNRIKADFGIFKYMLISIGDDFFKLFSLQILGILKFMFYFIYLPMGILKLIAGFLIWQVMIFGSRRAFNYHNK